MNSLLQQTCLLKTKIANFCGFVRFVQMPVFKQTPPDKSFSWYEIIPQKPQSPKNTPAYLGETALA